MIQHNGYYNGYYNSYYNGYYFKRAIPALIVTAVVFILPVGAVFIRSLSDKEELLRTITDSYTWRLLGFSAMQAAVSAVFSITLALPFAAFLSRYNFRGRRAILTMCDVAFAIPTILCILGFVIYYGNNGLVNRLLKALSGGKFSVKVLYSFKAIIFAHVYLNLPIALSLITNSVVSMPSTEENAARLLGASELKTFVKITLPKVFGTIVSAFTLIFLFCFPSFLIIMTLGGNPRYYNLEAEIYKRTYTDVNPSASAALAMFSFLVMSILLIVTGYGKEEKRIFKAKRDLKPVSGKSRVIAVILCTLLTLFMAPPLLSILYRSFFTTNGSFTLKAWATIATKSKTGVATSLNAILNSLLVATLASFTATRLASSIALGTVRLKLRFLALLTSLPMAIGPVSLGLGFYFLSAKLPIRNLLTSYLFVTLAHTIIVLPFAVRTLLPGARTIPQKLSIAAKTLGCSDSQAFKKIESPLLAPYSRRSFAFCFALSLGEVNATLALGEGRVTTIPVLIYKLINQYNYQAASALAVILIIIALVVFSLGERSTNERNSSIQDSSKQDSSKQNFEENNFAQRDLRAEDSCTQNMTLETTATKKGDNLAQD